MPIEKSITITFRKRMLWFFIERRERIKFFYAALPQTLPLLFPHCLVPWPSIHCVLACDSQLLLFHIHSCHTINVRVEEDVCRILFLLPIVSIKRQKKEGQHWLYWKGQFSPRGIHENINSRLRTSTLVLMDFISVRVSSIYSNTCLSPYNNADAWWTSTSPST